MASRERKKDTAIREAVDALETMIMEMEPGDRASVNPLVYYHYSKLGYEKKD